MSSVAVAILGLLSFLLLIAHGCGKEAVAWPADDTCLCLPEQQEGASKRKYGTSLEAGPMLINTMNGCGWNCTSTGPMGKGQRTI